MQLGKYKHLALLLLLSGGISLAALAGQAQTPNGQNRPSQNPTDATAAAEAAEREKIWNSPEMVEARVWLETYFERSAQISPEEGKRKMAELQAMSPTQMQLWLTRFQAQRGETQQRQAADQRARRQAMAVGQSSPQVGGFRNPYAGRRSTSTGLPVGDVRSTFGGGANSFAQRPAVQKPFSNAQNNPMMRPLVNGEDFARREILFGMGWGRY